MFRKSFVSLIFNSTKLQVLLMDAAKKKVKVFGSFDLPAGIIQNYRVIDAGKLAEFIKGSLKALKISEKKVAIVVPEYSTYTKSLVLPKLGVKDLDEAVRWQTQEMLPGADDMVMDWQIVEEKETDYLILVSAIHKDVLSGYVDGVVGAGLFPLVVETPSLSLTRAVDGDKSGKLIIYVAPRETILVVAAGERIVATSVASSASQNDIIQTAKRMLSHYQNIKIEKVRVGGAALAQSFLAALADGLGREIYAIKMDAPGIEPGVAQEYLVAISLQRKDPAIPESESTINLLPPSWAKLYEAQARNIRIWTLSLIGSFIVWACFLIITIAYMIFISQINSLEKDKVASENPHMGEAFARVEEVNKLAESVDAISKGVTYPEEIINQIASVKPLDITLTYLNINLEKGTLTLAGHAANRAALVEFKEKIEATDEFAEVALPITSFINEQDFDFDMSTSFGTPAPSVPKLAI